MVFIAKYSIASSRCFTKIIINALLNLHKMVTHVLTNSVDSCIILNTGEMVTEK